MVTKHEVMQVQMNKKCTTKMERNEDTTALKSLNKKR